MIEWHEKEVMNAAKLVLRNVNRKVAENVMEDAKKILKQKAETTTERGLLSQFDVRKSKYDKNTFLVYCQGPGNWRPPYHASFVELGTHNKTPEYPHKMTAKPFMRPARKKNIRKANKMYQDGLDRL